MLNVRVNTQKFVKDKLTVANKSLNGIGQCEDDEASPTSDVLQRVRRRRCNPGGVMDWMWCLPLCWWGFAHGEQIPKEKSLPDLLAYA